MTERDPHDPQIPRHDDVGAWLLGALDDAEATDFAAELERSQSLRDEVARLQPIADALPMGAEQMAAPEALRGRIMDTVRREAQMTRAAAGLPEPAAAESAPPRSRWSVFGLRPAFAGGLAALLIAVVVGGAVLASGGDSGAPARTVQAQVDFPGAKGVLLDRGAAGAQLRLTGLPAPASGRIYEVWVIRDKRAVPAQAALFAPHGDRRSTVDLSDRLAKGDVVAVTEEPAGGSQQPTGQPIVVATV